MREGERLKDMIDLAQDFIKDSSDVEDGEKKTFYLNMANRIIALGIELNKEMGDKRGLNFLLPEKGESSEHSF